MELTVENERRFLVKRMPRDYLEGKVKSTIEQWYICLDPVIRVRSEVSELSNCCLTIKIKKKYGEDYEIEGSIPITSVPILAAVRKHNKIFKTRYAVSNLELNIFLIKLLGLIMLEFEQKLDSDAPRIPLDFSVIEVTDDERFRSHNLAKLDSIPENWKCEII